MRKPIPWLDTLSPLEQARFDSFPDWKKAPSPLLRHVESQDDDAPNPDDYCSDY